jgi:RimJ/RimL family protein N-acetyltransferase
VPVLETERRLLRPFEAGDLDSLAAMLADPEVMRFMGGEPMSREDAWRHLALVPGHELLGEWAVTGQTCELWGSAGR